MFSILHSKIFNKKMVGKIAFAINGTKAIYFLEEEWLCNTAFDLETLISRPHVDLQLRCVAFHKILCSLEQRQLFKTCSVCFVLKCPEATPFDKADCACALSSSLSMWKWQG